MNVIKICFALCILCIAIQGFSQNKTSIAVEWKDGLPAGEIRGVNSHVTGISILKGKGKIRGNSFQATSGNGLRILIEVDSIRNQYGSGASVISVRSSGSPFSFFLRDVTETAPIYLPDYGVVVLKASDSRSYNDVEKHLTARKLLTKTQQIEREPETSFDQVEEKTRNMSVPTWLGTSRDFRIFEISESLSDGTRGEANIISPKLSSSALRLPGTKNEAVNYLYTLGRGIGPLENISRHLEQGALPILHSTLKDDDIVYHSKTFVTLEASPLARQKGTDFLVADQHSGGHMFTPEQEALLKTRTPAALNTTEETVLVFRSDIVNRGNVPRYAWLKIPRPGTGWWHKYPYTFDENTGFSAYDADKVFCISRLNGKPVPNEEIAVLLQPGEKAVLEFYLPHSPVSRERAARLATLSFDQKYRESKDFWSGKLRKAAQITVPEKRVNEMIKAGLLHLDLITFGNEPDGTLAPNIGVYSPIGTESAPIIQYYASVGWTEEAKRSLTYFLDKQHENGFIQNFGGYMVETGAALWSMGEYFRYTRDAAWIQSVKPKLLKSCDYLIQWRNRNKKEELRGQGYGMIEGKVADPEDHFHQFMLNGYAYLGMSRIAEVLREIDPAQSEKIRTEADAWKEDIRESFFNAMALSPVVPLGDGSWSPTAPPWTGATGPRNLYQKRETFWSHGTFTGADALLGPLYLVFCEVIDPEEPAARMMLTYHSELFYQGNAAFSQPYYSRHNWLQARLGMVKPFLSTYYNTFSAHADRETYTFWEHMYKVSPHKTHEEAWFLMETRWMLYMENGDTLSLLRTIPRAWMEDGKEILLDGVKSYFGDIKLSAKSNTGQDFIEASIECRGDRKPRTVTIRLPHPENRRPVNVTGGTYDEKTETITVGSFNGTARIRLDF